MKISLLARSTYPNKSPRAMRTHELAKELARDHEVTLLVLTGDFDYTEYQRQLNIKLVNLGKLKFSQFSPELGIQLTFFSRIIKKVFGRLLEFPDVELAFLVYKHLVKSNDMDLLITVGIPHPIHWGAALAKYLRPDAFNNVTWVADCGDPYMGNPFHIKPFYFKFIEKFFCERADYISVPADKAIKAYYPEFQHKIRVIPQGFELIDDFIRFREPNNKVVTFIYAGTFYDKFRDPRPLLDYLLKIEQPFEFIIHTRSVRLIERYKKDLGERLKIKDYLPRQELIKAMSACDFLINVENVGGVQVPSKLIDYILSGRPVLSIDTSNTEFVERLDHFLKGDYSQAAILPDVSHYDIKNVANKFIGLAMNVEHQDHRKDEENVKK